MAKGKTENKNALGAWTFLIGAILAVAFGLFGSVTGGVAMVLALIGIIVGFLNIGEDETEPFLMSGTVLIIAGFFGMDAVAVVPYFKEILKALLLIFVPATIIVAIRNVFSMARH